MMLLMQLVYVLLLFRTSMRRLLLIGLLAGLLGASPAGRAPVLNGANSDAACDSLIRSTSPTLWLDSSQLSTITAADNAVSAWASRTGSISFSQATAANKPKLTRGDNLENRVIYSSSIDQSPWASSNGTRATANEYRETAATGLHILRQPGVIFPAGVQIKFSAIVKPIGGRNIAIGHGASGIYTVYGLSGAGTIEETDAGLTNSITALPDGEYEITYETIPIANVDNIYFYLADGVNLNYAGDIAKGFDIRNVVARSSLADPTYLPTTSAPQYRGVNGRPAVFFDGVDDVMTSAATIGDFFTDSAKTLLISHSPLSLTASQLLFWQLASHFGAAIDYYAAGDKYYAQNRDAGGEDITPGFSTSTGFKILVTTHDGVNLTQRANNGEIVSVASGATGTTNTTPTTIGGSNTATYPFAGPITDVITWNKVLPASTISQITRCKARQRGADLR